MPTIFCRSHKHRLVHVKLSSVRREEPLTAMSLTFQTLVLLIVFALSSKEVAAVWQHGDKLLPHMEELDGTTLAKRLEPVEYYDFGHPQQHSSDRWMVVFHSTSCDHCHEFLVDAEKIAETLVQRRDNHHAVASVDCGMTPGLCRRLNVGRGGVYIFESGSDYYWKIEHLGRDSSHVMNQLLDRSPIADSMRLELPNMSPLFGFEYPSLDVMALVGIAWLVLSWITHLRLHKKTARYQKLR